MATTVGSHAVSSFTSPTNGDPLDATVVKGNDNTIRNAYVDHDADPGIHLQSSTLAARPAAGTAGRKWMTTDTGAVRIWHDNGSTWEEVAYLATGNLTTNLIPNANNTYDIGSGANQWKDVYAAGTVTAGTAVDTKVLALDGASSGTVTVQPAAAAGTWTMTLPTTAGTNGYVLQTNGSGVTTWAPNAASTGVEVGATLYNRTFLK